MEQPLDATGDTAADTADVPVESWSWRGRGNHGPRHSPWHSPRHSHRRSPRHNPRRGQQTANVSTGFPLRSKAALALAAVLCAQPFASAALADDTADLVWVRKSERTLHLLRDYEIVRSYPIALGRNPVGHKTAAGDSRTPEGLYWIDWRNPNSRFHLSLHVSYPNENDLRRARRANVDAGDNIMIHGQPGNVTERGQPGKTPDPDWTDGCIALDNRDMEEVWRLVADDTPILIEP